MYQTSRVTRSDANIVVIGAAFEMPHNTTNIKCSNRDMAPLQDKPTKHLNTHTRTHNRHIAHAATDIEILDADTVHNIDRTSEIKKKPQNIIQSNKGECATASLWHIECDDARHIVLLL